MTNPSPRSTLTLTTLAAVLLFCCTNPKWPEPIRADYEARSRDYDWPPGYNPEDADLFAHNESNLNTPCDTAWRLLVNASAWPTWYANASHVNLAPGQPVLVDGSIFTWSTFGLTVESRVAEFVPASRLAWFGRASGLSAYHTWSLHPAQRGCHVITEEVGKGPLARRLAYEQAPALHDGHARWLANLAAASEALAAGR